MEEKLICLYKECIEELSKIGISIINPEIGTIQIKIAKWNNKRYGCCKQEEPDKSTKYYETIRNRRYIKYGKFKKHTIEISKWVMGLEENIIKNTIMHEIIHCLPYCNNHGEEFKKKANYINQKLGYEITRVGDKKEDYKKSNIEYTEMQKYKYKIICTKCGQTYYRQKLRRDLINKYRCGKCFGKLEILVEENI